MQPLNTRLSPRCLKTHLQCSRVLGGVNGGVGLVRLLALPWVGTPGLVQDPLGECAPGWTLCLLLHQGAEGQVLREDVCLRSGVTDVPETNVRAHDMRRYANYKG